MEGEAPQRAPLSEPITTSFDRIAKERYYWPLAENEMGFLQTIEAATQLYSAASLVT